MPTKFKPGDIFRPLGEDFEDERPQDDKSSTYYCMLGSQDDIDEEGYPILSEYNESKICAKIERGAQNNYYIRVGRTGRLYNPASNVEQMYRPSKYQQSGLPQVRFVKVQPNVFAWYKSFLKTKAEKYIGAAEREMMLQGV